MGHCQNSEPAGLRNNFSGPARRQSFSSPAAECRGLSGVDLAREAQILKRALPVLIVPGYVEVNGLASGLPRLTKPFSKCRPGVERGRADPVGGGIAAGDFAGHYAQRSDHALFEGMRQRSIKISCRRVSALIFDV